MLVKCELAAVGCLNNRQKHTFSQQHQQMLFLLQGDRVWLREDEQCLPSTVSSCSGGVVVFATDYGQVGVCVCVCVSAVNSRWLRLFFLCELLISCVADHRRADRKHPAVF